MELLRCDADKIVLKARNRSLWSNDNRNSITMAKVPTRARAAPVIPDSACDRAVRHRRQRRLYGREIFASFDLLKSGRYRRYSTLV